MVLEEKLSFNRGLFLSLSGEWETPDALFAALHAEFNFTLDAAASAENAKLPNYFNKEQDALTQPWAPHRVWLNPPYGRQIACWVKKAYEESERGAEVVCLLPARTDTAWFQDYVLRAAAIYFIRGRLKFGGSKQGAPFPSCLVFFGGYIAEETQQYWYAAVERYEAEKREERKRLREQQKEVKSSAKS